jgi:hypothetical protein
MYRGGRFYSLIALKKLVDIQVLKVMLCKGNHNSMFFIKGHGTAVSKPRTRNNFHNN